ncbi:hypothetical protein [Nocardioides nanhaiensis]|uniref:WXG100 family type VII secretion target n=1 Tax=Nocardioides nanhaiensis TaxID=1476871 RepID=A0ABP8VYL7_9ACTN
MDELAQEVFDLIDDIFEKFERLRGIVDGALSGLSRFLGWLGDKIVDKWNEFVAKWDEFWAAQELFWTNFGDRGRLQDVSDNWTADVGSPVTSSSGEVDRALLQADDQWTGEAADTYFPKAQLHKTAMERVQANFVTAATSAMSDLRSALTTFYTTLSATLATFIGAMVGAAVASGTIFGIPAGIVIAIVAIAAAAGAFYWAGDSLKNDCNSIQGDLGASMDDKTGYPGGSWPPGAVLTA